MSHQTEKIARLRPLRDDDSVFLYRLYASVRSTEQVLFGMNDAQWEHFLRMQFDLQHTQYMLNYPNPSFHIIMVGDMPAGRLYVDRGREEMRIVDISLLSEFRGQGIGGSILRDLLLEWEGQGLPVGLHVEKINPARTLYERLGFRIKADCGVFWFMERPPAGAAAPVVDSEDVAGPA